LKCRSPSSGHHSEEAERNRIVNGADTQKFRGDNALCMGADFDAKSRKIRRIALPVDNDDVANKRYVLQSVKILKDRQDKMEKRSNALK